MAVIQKGKKKWTAVSCILLACLFVVLMAQTVYAAPANHLVTLTVKQVLTQAESANQVDAFCYRLTAKHTGNPMPAGSTDGIYTFTITGTDTVKIGPISFSNSGTYLYELAQHIESPKPGYRYDKQVYTISVYVSTDLEPTVNIKNISGEKVDPPQFDNAYNPLASDPALMVDPPVKKTVAGNPKTDSVFTFKLEAADKANPMPAGSKNGVKIIPITGSGQKDFGTWIYTQAGTYYYTVSEINTHEAGYTYDEAVYTITDKVEAVDGQLVLERTVTNAANKPVGAYTFINQYTPPQPGIYGPQTGDDTSLTFHRISFAAGCFLLLACIVTCLINRKKDRG